MKRQVAVTGIGFITPWGNQEGDLIKLLYQKKDKYKKRAEPPDLPYDMHDQYKWINECANMGYNAANLACRKSYDHQNIDAGQWGVYAGTALGGMTKTQQLICQAFKESGSNGISPAHSIHSGYHFMADVIAIDKLVSGPNITCTSGAMASGMMLLQAFDSILSGHLQGVIAVGAEYIDSLASRICRCAAGKMNALFRSGACSLILQEAGEIAGEQNVMCYLKAVEYQNTEQKTHSLRECLMIRDLAARALEKAGKEPEEIDLILFAGSHAYPADDLYYSDLYTLFSRDCLRKSIILSRNVGSFFGADSVMAAGIGAVCLKNQIFPCSCGCLELPVKNVLIFGENGSRETMAMVLSKGQD